MNDEKYIVSVSEPWDFESADRNNTISGVIINKISDHTIIFKADCDLVFEGMRGNILVLTCRFEENDFTNLNKNSVVINGALLFEEYSEKVSEKDLKAASAFVIIGSIRKKFMGVYKAAKCNDISNA